MEEIKSILVATDGSEDMDKVYKLAFDMAKALKAKILALYVVDIPAELPEDNVLLHVKAKLYEYGWSVLRSLKDLGEKEGIEVETAIEEGAPAEKILKVAKKKKVDMIVMGTTGRSGLDKILLGSVAYTVIKNAHCPVLAVRKTTT